LVKESAVRNLPARSYLQLAAIIGAFGAVLIVNRLAPAALVVEVFYLPLILCAAWCLEPRWAWIMYGICTLIFLGADYETSEVPGTSSLLRIGNYASEILVGALVTWLTMRARRDATKLRATCNSLRNSEEQLRRSESLYRSVVDNIPQCVFRKDLQGRFTYANSRFCDAMGRSLEQILGATDFEHCPVHLAIKYRSDDRRVAESGDILEIIEDLQLPDGSVAHLQTVKSPLYDAQGKVIGAQGIFWDITEKIRVQNALRTSESNFRTLAENLPDIIARFDRELRHIYVNRAVQVLTGRPPEDFIGKTNAELQMPDHLVRLWHDTIRSVFETGEPQTIEFSFQGHRGLRHFECRLIPEAASDGSINSVLGICRDVTERVHTHEQAQSHLAQLAHTTRLSMIGGLVSEITHEINQPLHAIVNFSQAGINVLQKTPIEQRPNLFNWLKQISEQANRAAEIIRNAGRFVRKAPSLPSKLDINALVRDSLLLINFDLRMHHVSLRCELANDLPPISADQVQLQQVLMNLIRNAMEAVAVNPTDQRELIVQTVAIEGGVQLSVRDNGQGLTDCELEQVFEPFFTTKAEGIGLGLAVSQSIIQTHRGRLWVQKNSDRGVTFHFTLPEFKEEPSHACCHA
jgi:PAS domain S-box-containing protein